MKSHNDWIVDLYYKEMVAQKNTERDRRISKKLQTQESTYKV